MGNHEIMTMAGLWEAWENPEDGQWLRACTIITTEANALMTPIPFGPISCPGRV